MSEKLLLWLNKDIVLSKIVKDIPFDFKNGYLFAELLYKTKQIPNLSIYKNTNFQKDIISNFCHLQKNFMDIGIILDEKNRNNIINAKPYASLIYLFKIKQVLSNKYIDLEQLKLKEANQIQKIYNKEFFKNENEKYLQSWQQKYGINPKNKRILRKNFSLPILGQTTEKILDEKYEKNGDVYNEIKFKYKHLELTDEEIKSLMDEMRKKENQIINSKYRISTLEAKKKLSLKKSDEEVKKKWELEMKSMKDFKLVKLKESWTPAIKYKLIVSNYFKRSSIKNENMSSNFDYNLKYLVDDNDKVKRKKISSEIIMKEMRKKLDNNLKNRKDKEKRERKRLKEEKDIIEMTYNKNNIENKHSDISEDKKLDRDISPENYLSKITNNNSIIKENIKSKVAQIRSRNINIKKAITESTNFQKVSETSNIEEQKQAFINLKNDTKNDQFGQTKFSSYSRLSENDYGSGLINEYISLHNNNIDINDRIKLFKTLIPSQFIENETKNIDLNNNNKNNSSLNNDNSFNIFDKSSSLNKSEDFNKNQYLEELDRLGFKIVYREYQNKLDKFNRNKNLISPILSQIIDLTECIYDYQELKKVEIIDNSKWDELMIKFKENKIIDGDEEHKSKLEEEEENDNYLLDYGDKLTNEDDKRRLDYVNYINIFNDLIIPNEERGKKIPYPELYQDFYESQNNQEVDIKDYEPNLIESENLYLPRNSKIKNYGFSDIMESIIENKYNDSQNKKFDLYNIINKYERKGKYYFLPIKMVLNGYPLSGKKTQCQLIKEKYKGIKIYNPQKMLRNKMREYIEYKSAKEELENNPKEQKPKQKKDDKSLEEKIKEFKPILKIIKPYIDYIDKINKAKEEEEKKKEKEEKKKQKGRKKSKSTIRIKTPSKENESETSEKNHDSKSNITSLYTNFFPVENLSEKEEILSNVYMKLILYQLEKDFPSDKNSRIKFIKNLNEKYKDYLNLKEKIKELNLKINEEKEKIENPEPKSKNKKENKILAGLKKELELATKNCESTKNSLYIGFIFVNFPKNLKEAEQIENHFTGYVSELEKELSESEKKLYNYRDIIDINIKKKTGIEHFSFFDLFIEFKITSEEFNRRYKGAKYDSLTSVIYHVDDNPPPKGDKKVESRLTPGIPFIPKEEVYFEKENYEVNIRSLERLYKAMTNGFGKVYMNIEQMDLNYLNNINNHFENAITDTIFNNYYSNLDIIFNNNIENNTNKSNENKDKGKDESSLNNQGKEEKINIDINKNTENLKNELNFSNEIIKEFDEFHLNYQSKLNNFNHFLICQENHVLNYLKSEQNTFISFLNRKTNKLEIANIYIKKYNDIVINHPEFKNEQLTIDQLSEDIKDVAKSIWINVQNKKIKDIKYLNNLKSLRKKEKECDRFFEYISSIFELEVEKYLLTIETIIKFYLSKFGLLNNIYGILDDTQKTNINNKYLLKVDHRNHIFQDINIEHKLIKPKNILEEEKKEIADEEKQENKEKNNTDNNAKDNNSKKIINQCVEDKINILFMNAFKIVIRQDELTQNFIEKIKNSFKHDKDRTNNKNTTNRLNNSEETSKKLNNSISSRSTSKRKLKKTTSSKDFQNDIVLSYEELKNQIIKEKRKLKYRLMFLKNYSLKYTKVIKNCFDELYNRLDELIILSVRLQNNSLNNFINYLKKEMKYFNKNIDINAFEFDTFDNFKKHKLNVLDLYKSHKKLFLFNSDQIKVIENNKPKLNEYITEEEMNYVQLYVYNIKDLMNIYNHIKLFGVDTCNYFVKYEIVNEILVMKYFNNKKYGKYENQTSEDEFDRVILNETIDEENNGICNKILFASNINYIKFLNNFVQFNNNFININELFTSLLILGSELITADKFFDLIKEYIPENKREEKNIFLTKEEFMELPMWFESDDYLNILKDSNEKERYYDIKDENNTIEEESKEKKPLKIDDIKEAIFEINAENNILELNKIISLLNKLNEINLSIENNNKYEDSNKNNINIRINNKEPLNKITEVSNDENNKMNTSKLNLESQISSSFQGESKNKVTDSKIIENINNIYNILFN